MKDILSAASLLMAIISLLFGLWYRDISKQFSIHWKPNLRDRPEQLKEARLVLWGRAFPLAIGSSLITLVFLPKLIKPFMPAFQKFLSGDNTLAAAYFIVVLLMLLISIYSWVRFIRLLCIYTKKSKD